MNSITVYGEKALAEQPRYTVNELYLKWISYIGDKAEKTVETYTRNSRRFLAYISEKGLQHPQREDIVSYKEYLLERYKPTTVQAYITAVKLFSNGRSPRGCIRILRRELRESPLTKNSRGTTLHRMKRKGF